MATSIRYLSIVFLSLFFLAGCASSFNKETPEAFANRFYSNVAQQRTDELMDMFDMSSLSKEDIPLASNKLTLVLAQLGQDFENRGGITHIDINNQNISEDGQSVDLDTTVYFQNGSTRNDSMHLVKTASGWKIY